jgi:hypothetical protein
MKDQKNLQDLAMDLVNKVMQNNAKGILDMSAFFDVVIILNKIVMSNSIEELNLVKQILSPLPKLREKFTEVIDQKISQLEDFSTKIPKIIQEVLSLIERKSIAPFIAINQKEILELQTLIQKFNDLPGNSALIHHIEEQIVNLLTKYYIQKENCKVNSMNVEVLVQIMEQNSEIEISELVRIMSAKNIPFHEILTSLIKLDTLEMIEMTPPSSFLFGSGCGTETVWFKKLI